MRPLPLLLLAAALALPTGAAQSAPPSLTFSAPEGTLREYRGEEVSRVSFSNAEATLSGADAEAQRTFAAQFQAALRAGEGEKRQSFKQFFKVLPAEGTPGRYLWNSLITTVDGSPSLRSVRTLAPGGGSGRLDYQPARPVSPEALKDPAQTVAVLLAQRLEAELAGSHAELLAAFDPASFGLFGQALTPGRTFTRMRTLRPPHPLGALGTPGQETPPVQVEETLRYEGEEGGTLRFTRQARVVRPAQVITGALSLITTLREYELGGELRLTREGLPVSATRTERYVADVRGSATRSGAQAGQQVRASLTVTGTSSLTLTFVK